MTTELAVALSYIGGFMAITMMALWAVFSYQAITRLDEDRKERRKVMSALEQEDVRAAKHIMDRGELDRSRKKNLVDLVLEMIEVEE